MGSVWRVLRVVKLGYFHAPAQAQDGQPGR